MNHCERCGFNWTEDEPRTSAQWTNACPRCQFRGVAPTHTGAPRPTAQSARAIEDEEEEVERQRTRPPPPEPEPLPVPEYEPDPEPKDDD